MDACQIENDISDHLDRCRLCIAAILENDVCFRVTGNTKIIFETLTSLELSLDRIFSPLMCAECNKELNRLWAFRESLISNQKKLYEFVYSQDEIVSDVQEEVSEDGEETSEYLIDDIPQLEEGVETEDLPEDDDLESNETDVEYIVAEVDDEPSRSKVSQPNIVEQNGKLEASHSILIDWFTI